MSDACKVREFTKGAGQRTPETPEAFRKDEVMFLCKMILDELMEFTSTVSEPKEAKDKMKGFIKNSKDIEQIMTDNITHLIAEQVDALVDAYYYSMNAATKQGMNISALFDIVHEANMAKRDPATGEFLKREDGKIIKPAGWVPPDVEGEMKRQLRDGALSDESSDFTKVREFTVGAGFDAPTYPTPFESNDLYFLVKMMLDEVMEFTATVAGPKESKDTLCQFIDESKDIPKGSYDNNAVSLIADQADALVDSYYYSLNACARKGINMSKVFEIVHGANMAKRDPVTGQFIRREDGKIIKPSGWQAPDIDCEIKRQQTHGAFPSQTMRSILRERNT